MTRVRGVPGPHGPDLIEALTFRTEELISREHQVWHSTQREGHTSTDS